jgi:hypothetical protein
MTDAPLPHDDPAMLLAFDYPLLSVFWSMMIFFLWIVWLMARRVRVPERPGRQHGRARGGRRRGP